MASCVNWKEARQSQLVFSVVGLDFRLLGKLRIPFAHAIGTGTTGSWRFAAEAARVPLGGVMRDQRVLGGEDPPFRIEGQKPAFHVAERDILGARYLGLMLGEPTSEITLALGRLLGCLTDVDERVVIV